jgi:hypothetical protein
MIVVYDETTILGEMTLYMNSKHNPDSAKKSEYWIASIFNRMFLYQGYSKVHEISEDKVPTLKMAMNLVENQ